MREMKKGQGGVGVRGVVVEDFKILKMAAVKCPISRDKQRNVENVFFFLNGVFFFLNYYCLLRNNNN